MEWISVKDEPPSYTVEEYFDQAQGYPIKILVTDGKDVWESYKSGDGIMFEAMNPTVTHWKLPEPPKQ